MAKKHFKGYKGKTSAKFIATGVTAGVITLAIIGGNIVSKLSNRPEPEHPYDDSFISDIGNNAVTEPPIVLDPSYEGEFVPEAILPELKDPIIPDEKPDTNIEDMSVEFVEVLAKLTNKSKEYIQSIHGNTPNLTIIGLNTMSINNNKSEVQLLGQVKVNDSYNYFVTSLTNPDFNLGIFNLPAENLTEEEFVAALDEILSHEETTFVIKLSQYLQLSNSTEIIDKMLQTRLNSLNAIESKDQQTINEISHLNNAIQNSDALKLSLILNDRVATDDGYNFSFSIAVNTGKYLYTCDDAIVSKRILTPTALKHKIEEYLSNSTELSINATPSSAINQVLHVINSTAFNIENEDIQTIG